MSAKRAKRPTAARSAPADPILAAIERHRVAFAAHLAAPEGAAREKACFAECKAACTMFRTMPTTLAGVIALLRYADENPDLLEIGDHREHDCSNILVTTLRRALTPLAARGELRL